SYTIPSAYVLQARNYFLTINLTKAQAHKIISYINCAVSKAQKATQPTAAFSIGGLPGSAKKAILKDAQNACAVIGCKLTYNVSKKTVTIKSAKGTEIFNSGPIVKRTGANMDATPIYLTAVITVTLFLAALIISKKARFFE
ncbi:MAG: hypothetical protein KBS52_06640, partial [Clostridiales bacterium]|nr:hypothetical protein [Candidatus Equinaster intestinalis]